MKNIIKQHFEKSYTTYNDNAIVQKLMAESLVSEILKISDTFNNILEIGTGTGILTQKIVQNIHYNKYFANDIVKISQKYLSKYSNMEFVCGDIQTLECFKNIDLMISNAVFQWFEDFEKTYKNIINWLTPDGYMAFSTFSPNNFKEFTAQTGLTLNYLSTEKLKEIIQKDFNIQKLYEFEEKINFKTPLELLSHLKKTGVNSLKTTPWTIKEIKDFCKTNLTTLTYAPIIVIAKKKQKTN